MYKRTLAAATFTAVAAFSALPAQALIITFSQFDGGGNLINAQVPGDGSGLTSEFIDPSNMMNPASGYFVETFDQATYTPIPRADGTGPAGTTDPSLFGGLGQILGGQADGCSINAFGGPDISTTGGGFAIKKGSNSAGAAPAGDNTCYAFGPRPNGGTPATVKIDYSPILRPGDSINYLGLYYGSIDNYNNIAFFNGDTELQVGNSLLSDGVLAGSEILAASGGTSGNQLQSGSNVYVNFFFEPGETFTAFEFRTTGIAFEFDNVVIGLASRDVPAPATLALIGLGLAGLSLTRRRRAV